MRNLRFHRHCHSQPDITVQYINFWPHNTAFWAKYLFYLPTSVVHCSYSKEIPRKSNQTQQIKYPILKAKQLQLSVWNNLCLLYAFTSCYKRLYLKKLLKIMSFKGYLHWKNYCLPKYYPLTYFFTGGKNFVLLSSYLDFCAFHESANFKICYVIMNPTAN